MAAAIAAVTMAVAVVIAFRVVPFVLDLAAHRREMAELRGLSPFDAHWLEINPDYVGWLKIEGTIVDFPVVRAGDNEKYLNRSFRGEDNVAGAIFMDYRVRDGAKNIIIYGHDVIGTSGKRYLFGDLHYYLGDSAYLAEHPTIAFMHGDSLSEFEIFSARLTDVSDPAYHFDFDAPGAFGAFLERNGAPPGAERVITLSTCFGSRESDKRVIIQGALKSVALVEAEWGEGGWVVGRRE